ncbi:MAG: hypothetical protein H6835_03265 [Planctomycetes bacterium]|nr:hypothetical protein [Planctomycetota bacterium]
MSEVFFGLQLAVKSPPGDPWRRELCELVRRHQQDLAIADKRTLYGAFANALQQALPRCPLGYWDYVVRGEGEYREWMRGIEDDAEERWVPDQTGEAMEYALVSAFFLMPRGSSADVLLAERCDIPEAEWMQRDAFGLFLSAFPQLRFASVRSDAIYVVPGGLDLAFSLRELQGDGYDYLLPIE